MVRQIGFVLLLLVTASVRADDSATKEDRVEDKSTRTAESQTPNVKLNEELRDALIPLFTSITQADVSRATVEMLADSVLNGQAIESQKSTFQIASMRPDKFTIYLKEPEQRTRIYCDGETLITATAPDAFFRLPNAISIQEAVTNLSVPMGPYPEPLLALTLAGADPAISLIAGMKSIEVVDKNDFRNKIPAVHIRGIQADAVTWDLWISRNETPKPLRLLVDLTPMLIASDQVHVPDGFSYQIRYDFLTWRISGSVNDSLFTFTPAPNAKEYKSLEDYYESIAGVTGEHPLLGKPAPRFESTTLTGEKIGLEDLNDRVVVIDFWATWCAPCVAAMPIIKEVTDKFAEQGVISLAINTGEEKEDVETFLKEQELDLTVLLDPKGKIADAYKADAIPQTIVIGKSGAVESVHLGFAGEEALRQRLIDELEVLSIGGKIGSVVQDDVPKEERPKNKPDDQP